MKRKPNQATLSLGQKSSFVPFQDLYLIPSKNGMTIPKRLRGTGVRMVNMGELFAHDRIGRIPLELAPVSESEIKRFSLQPKDLLFARRSIVLEGAGKCSIVTEVPSVTVFESSIIRVRLDPSLVNPFFYFYYFTSEPGKARMQTIVEQLTIAGIRGSELAELPVPYPPQDIQNSIVVILSAYDNLIENNRRRIQLLEEMARALYREWFVHFRFPGHEGVEMVDSELGEIPEGWKVEPLLEVSDFLTGYPFKSKLFTEGCEAFPVVRIRDILNNRTKTYTSEPAERKYIIDKGDVLVGMDGDFHMCIWANNEAYLNQRVARFRSIAGIPQYYLFLALEEPIKYLNATIRGTTVAHLGRMHLETIKLLVPEPRLLRILNETLTPMMLHEINLRCQNEALQNTRDLLLPRLISGQTDVSDLKIETTADAHKTSKYSDESTLDQWLDGDDNHGRS